MRHYQSIGTGLSFLIHLICILLILFMTRLAPVDRKIITIDFSIENTSGTDVVSSSEAVKTEGVKRAAEEAKTEGDTSKPVNQSAEESKPSEQKEEIQKEDEVLVSENVRENNTRKLTEERPAESAIPEEEEMTEELWASEVDDGLPAEEEEMVTEEVEPALKTPERPVSAEEAGDRESRYEEAEIYSAFQTGNGSSTDSVTEGKTDSDGTYETASAVSQEESFETLNRRYLKEHFNYIREMIQKNLSYPPIARRMGWTGEVLVSFIVCKDGRADNVKIIKSSGFAILDKNAIETIKKVSPFPRPPVSAELIVPIAYMLE